MVQQSKKLTKMTQLSKHSEHNLRVIQNFLLYANMEDELGEAAIDYILEDHVDGEDSEEAREEKNNNQKN
jgi:hypothetical protein